MKDWAEVFIMILLFRLVKTVKEISFTSSIFYIQHCECNGVFFSFFSIVWDHVVVGGTTLYHGISNCSPIISYLDRDVVMYSDDKGSRQNNRNFTITHSY